MAAGGCFCGDENDLLSRQGGIGSKHFPSVGSQTKAVTNSIKHHSEQFRLADDFKVEKR